MDSEHSQSSALSTRDLATLLIVSEREAKAADEQRDKLWDELVARMHEEGLATVDLPEALITYMPVTSAEIVDTKALVTKVEALGAWLRELGAHNVDDHVPTKTSRRAASLRIAAKL